MSLKFCWGRPLTKMKALSCQTCVVGTTKTTKAKAKTKTKFTSLNGQHRRRRRRRKRS